MPFILPKCRNIFSRAQSQAPKYWNEHVCQNIWRGRNQTADLRQIVQRSDQTGKDSLLKDMLRGVQKKTERRYRLLVRYLSDFL